MILMFLYVLCFNQYQTLIAEKVMAPHSSTLAWKIPWTEEPARLQSMESLRVGHDCATSLSLFTFMHWKRKWQPTPVFLPEESQGQRSLVGCCLWRRTELDTTEATQQQQQQQHAYLIAPAQGHDLRRPKTGSGGMSNACEMMFVNNENLWLPG